MRREDWLIPNKVGCGIKIDPVELLKWISCEGFHSRSEICIHAHLPREVLLSCSLSIRSAAAKSACTFYRWQEDRRFNEGCNTACSAL